MKKQMLIFFSILLLVCFFCYTNIETRAKASAPQVISPYAELIRCVGPSDPSISYVEVQRRNELSMLRKARIVVFKTNGTTAIYPITISTWKPRGIGPGIKAIFTSGNAAKLTLDAYDLNGGSPFESPKTAVLTLGSQTVNFSSCSQETSGYYWTDNSKDRNQAFTCPDNGLPGGCPGIQ